MLYCTAFCKASRTAEQIKNPRPLLSLPRHLHRLGAMELTMRGMQWDIGRGSKLPPAVTETKGGATLCTLGRSRAAHLLHEPGQQGRDWSLTRGSLLLTTQCNPEPCSHLQWLGLNVKEGSSQPERRRLLPIINFHSFLPSPPQQAETMNQKEKTPQPTIK